MKTCIILGARSDIAQALTPMLEADGWRVYGWARDAPLPYALWDLAIIAIGKVDPVGLWHTQGHEHWEECVRSNVLLPVKLLRRLWKVHNPEASVCFMAGSNPNVIMSGYSAYNTGKMALLKACEQLDYETPDAKFFALGPGITDTKIHDATKKAAWPNPRLERAIADGSFTPMEDIYACLKWCLAQSKTVIGGRNICVSDPWKEAWFADCLAVQPEMCKLRRAFHPLP